MAFLECKPEGMTREVLEEILDLAQELCGSTLTSMGDVSLAVAPSLNEEVWFREQSYSMFSSPVQGHLSHLAQNLANMGFQEEAIRIGGLAGLSTFQMRSLSNDDQEKLKDLAYVHLRLRKAAEISDRNVRAQELAYLSLFVPKAEREHVLEDVWGNILEPLAKCEITALAC